jgi:hypothetical protein
MTTALRTKPPLLDPIQNDLPVLANALLKPGYDRADLSRYGDADWDLSPAVMRENARRCHVTVHFDSVAHVVVRSALREYLYVRLNVDRPGYRPRLTPTSLRAAFNHARRFFEYVVAEVGRFDLTCVDQQLLDKYARSLQRRDTTSASVAHLLQVVFDLYELRTYLPNVRLELEPWPGRSATSVAGAKSRSGENQTPRMPEGVMTALLSWSLRYVERYATDILAARAELDNLKRRRDELLAADAALARQQVRSNHRRRLNEYLQRRIQEKRGVPVWSAAQNMHAVRRGGTGLNDTPINWPLIHMHCGINARLMPDMHLTLLTGAAEIVDSVANDVGFEVGGMDTEILTDPDLGRPWRSRFDTASLRTEERNLQAACYVICAYLTGMRDCEVQAMKPGCAVRTWSEDGIVAVHRVRSMAYKGKEAQGEPAEWVTIAPVARAIEILEQLSSCAVEATGINTLWPVLNSRVTSKTHVSAEIVRQLNQYRDYLNAKFGTEKVPAVPPGPDGEPWRITTRQFRRTIAWHIANRPFGTVAGMIQYKHASVAAFEGYAGSSSSGFRREVENQRALGQLDDVMTYFDERRGGGSLGGPAAARVGATLDSAASDLTALPGVITDEKRVRSMLKSLARTLHVGVLADCFFDPSTAVCLSRSPESDIAAPAISLCEPTQCPNACISDRHRPVWSRSHHEVRALLAQKRLPEFQKIALKAELDRIERALR